jgi:hypothetical protein
MLEMRLTNLNVIGGLAIAAAAQGVGRVEVMETREPDYLIRPPYPTAAFRLGKGKNRSKPGRNFYAKAGKYMPHQGKKEMARRVRQMGANHE